MSQSNNTDEPSKYCPDCNKKLPISEFHFFPKRNVYHSVCRKHQNERSRTRYIIRREERLEYFRSYRNSPAGKATARRSSYASMERDPEKWAARRRVRQAVLQGKISKQPCERCGSPSVEAHHYKGYDEAHWLDVQWLCRRDHLDVHKFSLASRGLLKDIERKVE